MPLIEPMDVSSPSIWWRITKQDEHYVGFEHKAPSIWWGNPYRIIIKKGNNLIATASSIDEFTEDWKLIIELTKEEIIKVGSITLSQQYLLNFWKFKFENNDKKVEEEKIEENEDKNSQENVNPFYHLIFFKINFFFFDPKIKAKEAQLGTTRNQKGK